MRMTKKQFDEMFRSEYMPGIWDQECQYDAQWTPRSIDRCMRAEAYDIAIDSYIKSGALRDRDYRRPRWLDTLQPRHHFKSQPSQGVSFLHGWVTV